MSQEPIISQGLLLPTEEILQPEELLPTEEILQPEELMHPVQSLPPDDSSSESSEDEEDLVKSLYGKLPEDLGFTLLGLGFTANDFKVLRRLKMDLDTFMTLSESELADLGVQESSKIKQLIKPNLEINLRNNVYSVFSKPKKSLVLSMDEIFTVLKGISEEVSNVNTQLVHLNSTLSLHPPVNYRLSKSHQSREVFKLACDSLQRHSLSTAEALQALSKKIASTTPAVTLVDGKSVSKKQKKLAPWIKPTLVTTTALSALCLAILVVKKLFSRNFN